jgi:hypothetical protein
MIKFSEYLIEQKNTHMEHAEEEVLNRGVEGTRNSINALRAVRDMLSGNATKKVDVTVKWDGCVHEDTIVLTNYGDLTMKDIVNDIDKYPNLQVKGIFIEENSENSCWVDCIGVNSYEGNKLWVEIFLEDGSSLKVTEDHEIHTLNRGWVKAKDLTENDDITEL